MSAEIGLLHNPDSPEPDYAEEALLERAADLTADYLLDYDRVREAFAQVVENGVDLTFDLASALTAWERAPENAVDEFAAILHQLMRYLKDQVQPILAEQAVSAAQRERDRANDL